MAWRTVKLLRAANAARLGTYLLALWKLFKHPQTPRAARWVAVAVIAYAVSPIDLIPDFIPVLGLLDDVVLLPMGIALAVKLTPAAHWQAMLREAEISREELPRLWRGAVVVGLVWMLLFGVFVWWIVRLVAGA